MSRPSVFSNVRARLKSLFAGGKEMEQSRLEEEIQSIIDEGEERGLIDEKSGEMIQSILEFRDTVAREVMIPRTEIVAVPSDAPIADIIEQVNRHGYTRMPVYEGSVDNIIGILNVKDLIRLWSRPVGEADLKPLLRKPYFIPETKNMHLLLHELKDQRQHMAIVIDEYGGTAGLVTLEDLIEEIVGEIRDEHDAEEADYVELPDGSILVDSRVEIEKLEERFGVSIPEGNYETLAGFILSQIRKIPIAGDIVRHGELEMTIATADERSIKKVKIRKTGETPPLHL
ncbi:MAG: hemolysin family protein [Syntrophales bacterium]|jgi:magnesium and cobalt transporter|nr:hemolysin family protein [Syntrophales bacterium]